MTKDVKYSRCGICQVNDMVLVDKNILRLVAQEVYELVRHMFAASPWKAGGIVMLQIFIRISTGFSDNGHFVV